MEYKKVKQAVEVLVFDVKEDLRDEFIKLDHEIWTKYLSQKKGFIKKEIIVSEHEPTKVYSVIYWNTVEEWKSIQLEELLKIDKQFTEKFGAENFSMVREIHNEHNTGLFKVVEFEN